MNKHQKKQGERDGQGVWEERLKKDCGKERGKHIRGILEEGEGEVQMGREPETRSEEGWSEQSRMYDLRRRDQSIEGTHD